ncbi:MAG: Ldh family oxidoreductase [Acidiferrobacterales bacterium]
MPRVTPEKLTAFTTHVLEAVGTPVPAARLVAQNLVEADLTGHESHGVLRLKQYCGHARDGYAQPAARPTIAREHGVTAVVDGRCAWGPVVGQFAIQLALQKAREHAVGVVSIFNCYHLGRLGVYPERAARHGFISMAFCNVHGSARMAPWGAVERRIPTNPIAVAIPTRDQPIVADLATSAVAEGKVRLAKVKQERVPCGWVFDAEGGWSDDPNELYGNGSLVPLGGNQGHKGYSLSVAMDLVGGVLSGAGSGLMTERYGNGVLLQVIDPAAFTDPTAYQHRIDAYVAYLKSARRRAGVKEVLLPGEIERQRMAERRHDGLELPDGVYQMLEELAENYKVKLEF